MWIIGGVVAAVVVVYIVASPSNNTPVTHAGTAPTPTPSQSSTGQDIGAVVVAASRGFADIFSAIRTQSREDANAAAARLAAKERAFREANASTV